MDRTDEVEPGATRTRPEPGETRRTLERAPGERFLERERAATTPADAGAGKAWQGSPLVRALAIGIGGAIVITLLGGPLSMTAGLVAVAAFVGWLIGAMARPGRAPAVAVAVGAVIVGLVGIWLFSRLEGGALGPIDYLLQVHGALLPIELLAGGLTAAAASR